MYGEIIRGNRLLKKSGSSMSRFNNNAPLISRNSGTAYMKICLKETILKCITSTLGQIKKICDVITPIMANALNKSKYLILCLC